MSYPVTPSHELHSFRKVPPPTYYTSGLSQGAMGSSEDAGIWLQTDEEQIKTKCGWWDSRAGGRGEYKSWEEQQESKNQELGLQSNPAESVRLHLNSELEEDSRNLKAPYTSPDHTMGKQYGHCKLFR